MAVVSSIPTMENNSNDQSSGDHWKSRAIDALKGHPFLIVMAVYILTLGTVTLTATEGKLELCILIFIGVVFLWWANKDDKKVNNRIDDEIKKMEKKFETERSQSNQQMEQLIIDKKATEEKIIALEAKLKAEENVTKIRCPHCKRMLRPEGQNHTCTGVHIKEGEIMQNTRRGTSETEQKCPHCPTIIHFDWVQK